MGATPSLGIRIAADISSLRANIADGKALIDVTTASLQKMAASLDGDRLVTRAMLAVAAIDKVGISTLTAAQAGSKLNLISDAMEKMELTGRPIPPLMQSTATQLQAIVSAAQPAESAISRLRTSLQSVGINLNVLTAAGAALALETLAKNAIGSASNLEELSAKTGITTDELQRLQYAGAQVGLGIDQIASGVTKFQKNLVEDGGKAAAALNTLGLNAQTLVSMSPGAAFELMAEKLSLIENPAQRSAIAIELLGKSGADLLPLLTARIKDLESGATIMSAETIQNLHTLEASWEAMKTNVGASIGQAISDLTSWRDFTRDGIAQIVGGVLGPGAEAWIKYWEAAKPPASAAPAWGALQTTSGPAVGNQSGPSNDVMAAYINLFSHQKEASAYQEQLAADAKKTAAAIQSIADNLSGKDITQKISETAAGVTSLGGASGVFASQLPALVKQLNDWYEAGYKLPPVLEQMLMSHLDLVDVLPKVTTNSLAFIKTLPDMTAAVKDEMKAESDWLGEMASLDAKISQAPFNIQKFLKENSIKIDPKTLDPHVGESLGTKIINDMETTLERGIPSALEQAFRAGGGGITSAIDAIGADIGREVGNDVGTKISTSIGGIGGSIVGGLATGGIGLAISGAFDFIGSLFHRNAGQDEIDDWAKSTFGSESQVHIQLEQLGAQGSILWNNLLMVPKGDAAAAKTAIDDITSALKTFNDTAAFQRTTDWADQLFGTKTQAALQQTATDAQNAYALMAASGKYSADELAAAWQKVIDAQNAVSGISGIDSTFGVKSRDEMALTATTLKTTYDEMVASGKYSTDQLAAAWQKVTDAQNAAMGVDQFGVSTSFANVQSLMQKYGLTADAGSSAFKANDVAELSGQLGQDYASLSAGGIWGTATANSMKTQIQQVITEALQSGGPIAGSLKEAIGVLVGEGGLTDLNGNALTSLSGLNFSADTSSQAAQQAALAQASNDAQQNTTDLITALGTDGAKGLNASLIEATGNVGDLVNALAGIGGWGGSPAIPTMDAPIHSVTSPGLVKVNPGDIVGMPHLTPGLTGGSSGGGEVHIHHHYTVNAIDSKSVEQFFETHSRVGARYMLPAIAREADGRRWTKQA